MAKIGVVFSNLGTPKSSSPQDVGRYLGEFLMDPHVIQVPSFFRFLLVKGLIVPTRRHKSAANYQKVWTDQGSPLLVETQKAAQALQKKLGEQYQVEVGMRYGEPSFATCKEKLKDCQQIIFFPQYPQYASSTVETGLEHFFKFFDKDKVHVIPPYFWDGDFLQAYGEFLKEKLNSIEFDHLLMSFHGLPESHILKSDPTGQHCLQVEHCCQKAQEDVLKTCYKAQCYRTAQGIARKAGLGPQSYSVSFQSRLGRQKWITPYTEATYDSLLRSGVKRLAVVCPGFSVDGLETLEEIAMAGQKQFLSGGGEAFHYVPCLNDHPLWIDACAKMITRG